MFKRILKVIGTDAVSMSSSRSQRADGPYKDNAINLIYELLFCDRLDLYHEKYQGIQGPPWSTILDDNPDLEALSRIAEDDTQESRVRMLAFNLLRAANKEVPQKILLGTIIEMHFPDGLDTLAVFADGSVRYINHTAKLAIVDSTSTVFHEEIQQVIATSKPIVKAIGPWDKVRLPEPKKENVRMTFLVSDGLYFGEGPMDVIQKEKMAAPLINAATSLLVKLVKNTINSGKSHAGDAQNTSPKE